MADWNEHRSAEKPAEGERAVPEQETLDNVLEEIARDAGRRPKRYARDAKVPEGGE